MKEGEEWDGQNRRHGHERRTHHDRREEVRFEPGKPDRRKNHGRRREDKDIWFHREG